MNLSSDLNIVKLYVFKCDKSYADLLDYSNLGVLKLSGYADLLYKEKRTG